MIGMQVENSQGAKPHCSRAASAHGGGVPLEGATMTAEGSQDDLGHYRACHRAAQHGLKVGVEHLAQWKAHFTRQLLDLFLDEDIFMALMKSMDERPELFSDARGRLLRFDAWRTAVLDGRWTFEGGYRERQSGSTQRLGSVLEAVCDLCRPRRVN
jgi:hypothetical protein